MRSAYAPTVGTDTVLRRLHTSSEAPRVGGQLGGNGNAMSRPVGAGVLLQELPKKLLAASIQSASACGLPSRVKPQQPLMPAMCCALSSLPDLPFHVSGATLNQSWRRCNLTI